jgi:hypothetical protein
MADLSCLAKIHCVADSDWGGDSDGVTYVPPSIVPRDTEQAIRSAIDGRDAQFMDEIVEFGMVTHLRRCRSSNARLSTIFFRSMVNWCDVIIDYSLKRVEINKFQASDSNGTWKVSI